MSNKVDVLRVTEVVDKRIPVPSFKVFVHITYPDGTSEEFYRYCNATDELDAMLDTEREYRDA